MRFFVIAAFALAVPIAHAQEKPSLRERVSRGEAGPTYESLLQLFKPVYRISSGDFSYPTTTDVMVGASVMRDDVKYQSIDLQSLTPQEKTASFLKVNRDTSYLDLKPPYTQVMSADVQALAQGKTPINPPAVYGFAYKEGGEIFLDYWAFHPGSALPKFMPVPEQRTWHQGDWERIRVVVDAKTLKPVSTVFYQHNTFETRAWSSVQQVEGRPIVYIADGSHASYPEPGKVLVDLGTKSTETRALAIMATGRQSPRSVKLKPGSYMARGDTIVVTHDGVVETFTSAPLTESGVTPKAMATTRNVGPISSHYVEHIPGDVEIRNVQLKLIDPQSPEFQWLGRWGRNELPTEMGGKLSGRVGPRGPLARETVSSGISRSDIAQAARHEALSAGAFLGGYFLYRYLETRDAGGTVQSMLSWDFAKGLGAFTVGARATEYGLAHFGVRAATTPFVPSLSRFAPVAVRGTLRGFPALAVGVILANAATGNASWEDAAYQISSLGIASLALAVPDLALRAFLYPTLLMAGPPGWVAIAGIEIAKVAILLYGSGKIEAWLRGLFGGGGLGTQARAVYDGVRQKIDAILPDW